MKRPLIAAAVTAAAFAGCAVAPPAQPAAGPAPPPHPCATATEVCTGTVEVPLNWDDPGSERIGVAFQRIPRRETAEPAAGTILVHMGGPPSPSIGPAERVQRTILEPLGPVHDHHDLVVADLRGLGASTPLACTGVDTDRPGTVAGCGEQLGPRAGWFALDQAVRDYDAVRAALGVHRLTLFGNSWGSELAQAYASRFPERVAAVFLNGAVPASERGYLFAGGPHEFLRTVIGSVDRACETAPACAALPGSTGERLGWVAAALRAEGGDASRLVTLLDWAAFDPRVGRDLDAALQAHLDGDPAPLRRLTTAVVPPPPDRPELPPDRAATLLLYGCSGADLPFDRTAPLPQRLAQLDAFYAERQPYAPFTREEAEAGSALADTGDLCVHWPWLRESAPVDATARPDAPVLQLAGGSDPTTVDAEVLGDRFPRHTLLRVPGGAHQTWDDEHPVDGWCARDAMRAFLLDPPAPVVGGCDRTTFRPAGSFPRAAADLPGPAAVGFATAVDATVPRHPSDVLAAEFTRPGVRGGTATGTADGVVTLQGYRFVEDAAVDGTVMIDAGHAATARLTVATPDGPHRVELTWPLLDPDATATGTLDGVPVALPPPTR
ncbi:alpha/beta fold hydrolase [Pseudonocardia humida]|uniref:Alpha/beta fold hydrolase n=1 Tax=Pseudonocardia humida TaxID=2800819 RepID=A0ABT0ZWG5_9PSEU|nr:alpha/beta hydrolase [Pseudonocardia humida]MCO1655080.1 alpha/beta fold hydrolase [Pseudonocardia humida]